MKAPVVSKLLALGEEETPLPPSKTRTSNLIQGTVGENRFFLKNIC